MSFKDSKFIFPKWANYVPLIFLVIGASVVGAAHFAPIILSASFLEKNYSPIQPIPYSHKLHVGKLGLDCRYCHTGAEKSYEAMVPPTSTCMNCHDKVKTKSLALKPLRDAHAAGRGVPWVRVHDLPDYVKFNHKAHVQIGVKCQTCHGEVQEMERVKVANPMSMSWCIQCHRTMGKEMRKPSAELFDAEGKFHKDLQLSKLTEKHISTEKKITQVHLVPWEEALKLHDKKVIHEGIRDLGSRRQFRPPTNCSGCHQ
jgi:hypothetical protein